MSNIIAARCAIYAIVDIAGRQYKVAPGQKIDVDRLSREGAVEFDKVLLIAPDGGKAIVGNPVVTGAKVNAVVLGEHRGKKITVFKFKAKTRYQRTKGHRQTYTQLEIKEIIAPQGEASHGA